MLINILTGILVDMSTDTQLISQLIYRPPRNRYVGRHIDQYIGHLSVDISINISIKCPSMCQLRVVVQLSADMLINRLPTFRQYFTDTLVFGGLWPASQTIYLRLVASA